MSALQALRFGHSPDPDDAFMFYGFAAGAVTVAGPTASSTCSRTSSRSTAAPRPAELEITAVSAHAYARLADRYCVLARGASVGRGYGPIVVARADGPLTALADLAGRTRRDPRRRDHGRARLRPRSPRRAARCSGPSTPSSPTWPQGRVDAGVIIHEGQLTYRRPRACAGSPTSASCGAPTPDCRCRWASTSCARDLGRPLADAASRALRASIEYARAHEEEALDYALRYGRGLERELGRRFVDMYVNADTLDLGPEGERALAELYERAAARGLIPRAPELVVVG